MYKRQYVPRPAPKRGRTLIVITLVCLALAALVALGAAAVLLWQGKDPFQLDRRQPTGAGENAPAFELQQLPEDMDDGLPTTQIAEEVGPSVVCINVYVPQSLSAAAYGSGVILNEEGFIVTNAHVIEGASAVSVILNDGREYEARIIGQDTQSDLAVIQIDAEDLTPAKMCIRDRYKAASNTERAIKVILFFSEAEEKKILDILNELNLAGNDDIVLIDARNDNKPSASNVKL